MHKKIPKICTGCRVSAAKIYLYHSTKIAKARPHSVEWQTDSSVQKQWFMDSPISPKDARNSTGFFVQFYLDYPRLLGDSVTLCVITFEPIKF